MLYFIWWLLKKPFVWLSCLNSIRWVQQGISFWRQCERVPLHAKLSSRRGQSFQYFLLIWTSENIQVRHYVKTHFVEHFLNNRRMAYIWARAGVILPSKITHKNFRFHWQLNYSGESCSLNILDTVFLDLPFWGHLNINLYFSFLF